MKIISLGETSYASLIKKIPLALEYADLVEVRLDCLKSYTNAQLIHLNTQFTPLFTLRSSKEGGCSHFTSKERIKLLKQIIDSKPKYLDLEFKRDLALLPYLKKESPKTQLILSVHDTKKMPRDPLALISKMKKIKPWKVKIVGQAKSTLDALNMLVLMQNHKNVICIAMGEKGTLTRVLGPVFNQPFTYASYKGQKTAAGQLTLDELDRLYNYSFLNTKTKLLGLLGSPISQSPGTRVYNQIFKKQKVNAIYVNLELEKGKLKLCIPLLQQLGFLGCSVTIPFKEEVLPFIESIEKSQKGIQSINTLSFQNGKIKAKNTDAISAVNVLKKIGRLKGKKVLLIGCGGTAKGIAFALKKEGASLSVVNRTDFKARRLVKSVGGNFIPFDQLPSVKKEDYDILVHTTPVGNGDSSVCIAPSKIVYPGKIVLDVILSETKLLKVAAKKGCTVIDGKTFWIEQGREQLAFWFKKRKLSTTQLMKDFMP